jgi:hypothetical protein
MRFMAWLTCWLVGWMLLPPLLAGWLPPPRHRVWRPITRRLMAWPLYPARTALVWRARCRCCAVWARPALTLLDAMFWPWFVAVTAWEARNWRVLARFTPDEDEPVPGSEAPHPPDRSEP